MIENGLLLHLWQLRYRHNNGRSVHCCCADYCSVIHIRKEAHNELTIHSVSDSTMTREQRIKVLFLVRSLDATCKETSKRCNQRGKERKCKGVQLNGKQRHRLPSYKLRPLRMTNNVITYILQESKGRHLIFSGQENLWWCTGWQFLHEYVIISELLSLGYNSPRSVLLTLGHMNHEY